MIIVEIIHTCATLLMKSFTCITSNDIVIISTRDRNDTAVVMQISFTELKSEIIASQIKNTSQRINASQRIDISQRIIHHKV